MLLPDFSQLSPLVLILGASGALLLPVLVIGVAISALMAGGTRFFKPSSQLEIAQTQFEKTFTANMLKPVKKAGNPNAEPLIIAGAGFFVFLAIGALMLRSIPGPSQMAKEEVKAPVNALATTGNFTEIVGQLPAGNADNGKKLFSSKACVGCHSLEDGKRLVGPSFYGLYKTAGSRKSGVGPKEYLYESIVKPNEYLVETYQQGLMPQNFATQLSAQEMSDLLVWIERDHTDK